MSQKPEQKCVFGVSEDKQVVLIGLPEAGWEFCKSGMTHTFDLTSLGVPVKIILFGGKDRKACLAALNITEDTVDLTGLDFGFGGGG